MLWNDGAGVVNHIFKIFATPFSFSFIIELEELSLVMRASCPKRSLFQSEKFAPCCRAIFAVYLISSVPWRIAFCPQFTFDPEFQWFITLDLLCTIFFSFETFRLLSKWSGTSIASSILPTTHDPTEQQQLDGLGNSMLNCRQKKTRIAWFNMLLFFASTAPLEYLAMLLSRVDLVSYVMMNRLLLLFYLPNYLSSVARRYIKSSGIQRTWILFFTMGLAAHLCACCFYYVAYQEAINGVTSTWPEAAGIYLVDNKRTEPVLSQMTSPSEAYITSLYWACVTMITTGFGDIVPLHISETVWCIVSMFVGVIITALTIANIQSLVTSVDAPRLNFQRKMEMIKKYMRYRNLPRGLQDRVLAFYDYQWAQLKGADEAEFLTELPQTLQQQVTNFMRRDMIASLPILRRANKALLNALVECSEMNVYSPKDCILQRGERCNGALLVSHGEVEILKGNVVERKMKRLDRFAEECLFIDKVASHTVRSKGFSEIVILPRVEFQRILASQCDDDHIAQMKTTAITLSQNNSKSKANKMFGSAEEFTPKGIQRHFHPNSLTRKIWDGFVLLGLIFYTFSIPLSFFYIVENTPFNETPTLLTLGYMVDMFFLVDVLLQWNYFMYLDEGLLVYDTIHIREKFYKQRNRTREMLALIPFDLIPCFFQGRFCHYFRLVKFVRLPNISMYKETVDDILNELKIDIDLVLYRVFKLNFFMVVVSHWVGCLWFMMGSLSKRLDYSENWLDADESNPSLSISHSDYGGFSVYLRSTYWAVVGMSTVGYGDIVPTNILETFYATIVILFGGLLLPAIVGGLAAYMSSFHKTEKLFHKRVAQVRQYLLKINADESVLDNCRRYFDYHWYCQGGVIEEEVSNELPISLSVEVAFQINGATLNSVPFLKCCDDATKLLLVTVLQPRVFIPSECVVKEGERGSVMYIIQRGTLEVTCSQVTGPIRILSSGDFFGESCLLGSKTNRATVTAVDYCDCFTLNKDDFNEVLNGSPAAKTMRVDLANSIMGSQACNKRAFHNMSRYPKCTQLMLGTDSKEEFLASPQHQLLPDSPLNVIWNIILLAICMYNVWIIPFRLAFSHAREIIFLDWMFDVLFFLDMILNYRYVAYFNDGELVTDAQKIKRNYMLTRFKMDLISTFPFDVVALLMLPREESWSIIVQDGLRLLKLFRLRRHFGTLDTVFRFLSDHHITLAPLRLAEFLSGVILIAHIAACGFFIFARWKYSRADCTAGSIDCWEGTWIMRQIYNEKIPQDGASVWQLYIRSLNWALPTLVVVVIGDVTPTTSPETLYALLWMLVGVTINASIVGNVANIVANLETDSSDFANAIDNIRNFLSVHHLSHDFHERVNDFARYLWTTHNGTVSEDDFILRLPHMLQTQIIEDTRMRHINACPFFHSLQNDVVEALALCMQQLVFCAGDTIIHAGDMGSEMFFLERGTVRVVSPDHKTIYATLSQRGSFFGETCLFLKKPRSTSVCAQTFSDVFQLGKDDLFNELKRRDIDLAQMRSLFFGIHKENDRRNKAIEGNLIRCKERQSKLSKLIDADNQEAKERAVPKIFLPGTRFRFIWDVFSTLGILYYCAWNVLYQIAFRSVEEESSNVGLELLFELFFIIDCYVLRSSQFAFMENGTLHQNKADILNHYKKNGMIPDAIASFSVLSIIFPSYQFRLLSLVRILRLPFFLDSLCAHLDERGIRISLASNLLAKIVLLYMIACHEISCIWFIIHRYVEHGKKLTWATSDCPLGGDTGSDACLAMWDDELEQHNVCNMNSMNDCYIRAFHFSLTTLSTVGYGDISPATELETIWELFVVLVGACFLAALIGAFGALQQNDTTGQNSFYAKIERVKQYMRFRDIPPEIQHSILFFHQCRWETSQTLDERETLSLLPQPLQLDISFAVMEKVIHRVPILESLPIIIQKRIAHALRPQVYAPRDNPIIYSVGDIGWDLGFIASGFVSVTLPDDATELDAAGRANFDAIEKKFDSTGLVLGPGSHIGESCLCSSSGVRQESARAATRVEIYALCKDDFDEICRVMGPSKGKKLKDSLLTRSVAKDEDDGNDDTDFEKYDEDIEDTEDTIFRRRKKQTSGKRNTYLFPTTPIPNDFDRATEIRRRRRVSVPGGVG